MGVKRLFLFGVMLLILNGSVTNTKDFVKETYIKPINGINRVYSINSENVSEATNEETMDNTTFYNELVEPVQEEVLKEEKTAPVIWGTDGMQGNMGRLSLPSIGFAVPLYDNGPTSWVSIVDNPNSALYTTYLNKGLIADHSYQGFDAMKSCNVGTIGYIIVGDVIKTIECASKYQGINNGFRIEIGESFADELNDGSLYMYTCNDASGRNVTITFWNIIA